MTRIREAVLPCRISIRPVLTCPSTSPAGRVIACGNTAYVTKFDMIKTARPGSTFLLNTPWVGDSSTSSSARMKQTTKAQPRVLHD